MQTVLLVEDDEEYRQILSEILRDSNLGVVEAANGEEGLRALQKSSIDLILLDLIMTKMDGIKFYNRYKKLIKKKIPILILTNLMLSNIKQLVKKPEIKGYLIKTNVSLEQIVQKIQSVLKGQK
ncbi:response regulator transcription factor [Candidatus Roizmanbacteria bacterium]|nr:response regulator transcription factor [Candidatus Roizmanbacteria bacterium]